jgi:two-component system response regulator MprA
VRSAGLCEDDDELRGIVKRALEDDGLAVEATPWGQDAVRAFTARRNDVLILDVGMPDADGRDVCAALRARGVTSPVLFLTVRDALHDRLSGFASGAALVVSGLVARRFAAPRAAGGVTAGVVAAGPSSSVASRRSCGRSSRSPPAAPGSRCTTASATRTTPSWRSPSPAPPLGGEP